MHYQKISPVCATTQGPVVPLKKPRFCDGRNGAYKPHTDVMNTWIEHGFIPPTMAKMADRLFNQDKTWQRIKEVTK